MDEDLAWLDVVASFDTYESTEELLDALLNGAPSDGLPVPARRAPSVPQLPPPPVKRTTAAVSHAVSPSTSSSSDSDAAVLEVGVSSRRKRKKASQWRPRTEILRLQQSVRDLEDLLSLLKQRNNKLRSLISDPSLTPPDIRARSVWEGVARRQYQHLRQSQLLNEQLRGQVQAQLGIVKSLARLVERAQAGLPTQSVLRDPAPQNAALIAESMQAIATRARTAYHAATKITRSVRSDDTAMGTRDLTVHRHSKRVIPPGGIIGSSRAELLVPVCTSILTPLLWSGDRDHTIESDTIQLLHCEETHETTFIMQLMTLPMDTGPVQYFSTRWRQLYREASRDILVICGMLWPFPGTPSPVNAVDFCMDSFVVIQPCESSEPEPMSELIVKMLSTRRASSPSEAPLSQVETSLLVSFVTQAHNVGLDAFYRGIDEVLLRPVPMETV